MGEQAISKGALIDEGRFRLLVQSVVNYAIYMLDLDGVIVSWNSGAERIKGYGADEIIGQHFSRFYTEEDRQAGVPGRALEIATREGKFEVEGWRVRKDGSRFWASVVIDAIRDESGQLVAFAKVTRDLTERRQAQLALEQTHEQLHQSQKMEALGQLTGGIAHDFNNILTAIVTNVELARIEDDSDSRSAHLEAALSAAYNGSALGRQMLVFARKQPVQTQIVDVNEVIRELDVLIRRSCPENIAIRVELAPTSAHAKLDPAQLQTSLLNLVLNARDAMPAGGTLTITTESQERTSILVADTGSGMTEETLQHALEPFFTTKEIGKGTGLGLSMVYGATRQAAGDMTIDSKPGEGTAIRLSFPRSEAPTAAAQPDQGPTPPVEAGEARSSLLYVEDDPLVGMATLDVLQSAGYCVQQAMNAEEALALLAEHSEIDLLVTDVGLPGVSGYELAERARRRLPDLKVLFVTGYDRTGMVEKMAVGLGTDFQDKPYDPDELVAKVRRLLGFAPALPVA